MNKVQARERRTAARRRIQTDHEEENRHAPEVVPEASAQRMGQSSEALIDELIETQYGPNQRTAQWTADTAHHERDRVRWWPIEPSMRTTAILGRLTRLGLSLGKDTTSQTRPPAGHDQSLSGMNTIANAGRTLVLSHSPIRHPILEPSCKVVIGQVWLSVLTDLQTGLAAGYQISCEKEPHIPILQAVAAAILPKEDFLARLGLAVQWPIWGRPVKLLIPGLPDRATEMVTGICRINGIQVNNISTCDMESVRLIDRRREQLRDNLEGEGLPRLGLSLVRLDKNQDPSEHQTKQRRLPDANLVLMMPDLQRAVARAVCYRYNQMADPGRTLSRIARWKLAITGDQEHAGVGLPEKPGFNDVVDLLPRANTKVGPKLLNVNDLSYASDEARAHQEATYWENATARYEVQTIEDPLDVSHVWMKHEGHWLELRRTNPVEGHVDKWTLRAQRKARVLAERNKP